MASVEPRRTGPESDRRNNVTQRWVIHFDGDRHWPSARGPSSSRWVRVAGPPAWTRTPQAPFSPAEFLPHCQTRAPRLAVCSEPGFVAAQATFACAHETFPVAPARRSCIRLAPPPGAIPSYSHGPKVSSARRRAAAGGTRAGRTAQPRRNLPGRRGTARQIGIADARGMNLPTVLLSELACLRTRIRLQLRAASRRLPAPLAVVARRLKRLIVT